MNMSHSGSASCEGLRMQAEAVFEEEGFAFPDLLSGATEDGASRAK